MKDCTSPHNLGVNCIRFIFRFIHPMLATLHHHLQLRLLPGNIYLISRDEEMQTDTWCFWQVLRWRWGNDTASPAGLGSCGPDSRDMTKDCHGKRQEKYPEGVRQPLSDVLAHMLGMGEGQIVKLVAIQRAQDESVWWKHVCFNRCEHYTWTCTLVLGPVPLDYVCMRFLSPSVLVLTIENKLTFPRLYFRLF